MDCSSSPFEKRLDFSLKRLKCKWNHMDDQAEEEEEEETDG